MNNVLVENWNEYVAEEDTVFVVGDFAMGNVQRSLGYTPMLIGKKILVTGNHDKCFKNKARAQMYLDAGFTAVMEKADFYFDDYDLKLTISHFPFYNEGQDSRYVDYRPKDDGQWLICGHVHDKWKTSGRQINVGVDVWDYRPASLDEVLDLMVE